MLLSVVIPVKNGMPYIRDAVESVLCEKSVTLELVISDNFSNDGTSEYLASLKDTRMKLIKPATALSAAENWTFVSNFAQGQYIKLLCADDIVVGKGLLHQIEVLEKNPDVDIVASSRKIIGSSGNTLMKSHGRAGLVGRHKGDEILRRSFLTGTNLLGEPSALMFKTSTLKNALPWIDLNPFMLDFELYSRVLLNCDVYLLDSVDSSFRVHGNSTTARYLFSHYRDFKEMYKIVRDNYSGFQELNKFEILQFHFFTISKTIARALIFTYAGLLNNRLNTRLSGEKLV